jgi:hypothetical protein
MFLKSIITASSAFILLMANSAFAYTMTPKFETKHYAVYEVILGKGEDYNSDLKNIISKDIATRGKFQATAAVFPFNSDGLKGTIKEPMLGMITSENYNGKTTVNINIDDKAKFATYAGIYIGFNQLSRIADNKGLDALSEELTKMPLVIYDVPVTKISEDYKGQLFYIASNSAVLIDFNVIDSIYYDAKKLRDVSNKCRVNILTMTDRFIETIPFYMAAHGAVNDIVCK